MPAAAVIPAPGVHGTIAETKTSVVGTRTAPRQLIRHARSGMTERGAATTPRVLLALGRRRASVVRVRDLNQAIEASSCSMVQHGIVERG